MRISDWSSDVCSSDLSTRSASGARTEPQRRGSSGIATCPAMSVSAARRRPLAGLGWEIGLLVFMGVLYAAGTLINPEFFGDFHALRSTLRDAARYGVKIGRASCRERVCQYV